MTGSGKRGWLARVPSWIVKLQLERVLTFWPPPQPFRGWVDRYLHGHAPSGIALHEGVSKRTIERALSAVLAIARAKDHWAEWFEGDEPCPPPVEITRACGWCGHAFKTSGNRRYHDDACKRAAKRQRDILAKRKPPPPRQE